jgi:hypothetical protein
MISNSAIIGDASIPCPATLRIEETSNGYYLSGFSRDETEKLAVLRNLGQIRSGKVEHAKFVTRSGQLIDGAFEVTDARFAEEEFPDHRRLVFGISLKSVIQKK